MSLIENELTRQIKKRSMTISKQEKRRAVFKKVFNKAKDELRLAAEKLNKKEMTFSEYEKYIDNYVIAADSFDRQEAVIEMSVSEQKKDKQWLRAIINDRRQAAQNAVKRFVKSEARLMEFLSNPDNKQIIKQYHTNKKG